MIGTLAKSLHPRSFASLVLALLILAGGGLLLPAQANAADSPDRATLDAGALERLKRPVVVELFTSEGCSSCPPADRFAGELSTVPGILTLSFHIDYWDYIGWRDPFASPLFSQRQRDYSKNLPLRYVYTPQMVVDGRYDVVGFHRDDVFAAIQRAAADQPDIVMTLDPATARLSVPAGPAPAEGATLWLAFYDRQKSSNVTRGENAGRRLTHYNVVRDLQPLGTWSGDAMEIDLGLAAADDRDACAVLLQSGTAGPVLSAVTMALPRP
jgi:hypothetical protein